MPIHDTHTEVVRGFIGWDQELLARLDIGVARGPAFVSPLRGVARRRGRIRHAPGSGRTTENALRTDGHTARLTSDLHSHPRNGNRYGCADPRGEAG
ncbi:hypothetical protein SAMN04487820_11019 [Actinopolyspora mzabensis]|uniref:Uncharacterized protein n=1 Tax=Actinopolyspora mzabensis TaxID=995066 RepID=A0A1G9DDC4_ACTMZ|nr:hypothetical protein SAMN04487820_11019 [Actinopolyspora mzabensis]